MGRGGRSLIKFLDNTAAPTGGLIGTRATLGLCLTAQESVRATPTTSQRPLSILPQGRLRSSTTPPGVVRIPLLSHSDGLGDLRGVTLGQRRYQKNDAPRLPAEPQRPGGRMTAEVAILNRSAVALAADSKMFVGGGASEKTYDSVNKIFTLSKIYPIGIMVYGNADFMSFPWETIIKQYRHQKGKKDERTVDDWGGDFCRYLRTFGRITREQKADNIRIILQSVFTEVENRAIYIAHRRGIEALSTDYEDVFIEQINEYVSMLQRRGPWIGQAAASRLLGRYMSLIADVTFEFSPNKKSKKFAGAAVDLAGYSLVANSFSPQCSGIVVSGFGRTEIFPGLISYLTDGFVSDRIKLSKPDKNGTDEARITNKNQSAIMAFAQHDIVHRFMEGIDPDYNRLLENLVRTSLIESNLKTFDTYAPKSKRNNRKLRESVAKAARTMFQKINKDAEGYRNAQFGQPTMDMIAVLPKDELAKLAKSLVDLTSLHRRVARDMETVGGPIDVAVISKGDGFIWVKRKHYFNLEMNRHFELNYMRSTERG